MKFFCILYLSFFGLYINCAYAKEFNVAIEEFSYDIRPESFQYHPMVYILRQLHETLFTKTTNGLGSNILKSWDAEQNFKVFKLCLKPDVYFSNNKKVQPSDLTQNLKFFAENKLISHSLMKTDIQGDCATIQFAKSYIGFSEDFQSLRFAIIDMATRSEGIPVGISIYKVKSFDGTKLALTYRNRPNEVSPLVTDINIVAIGKGPLKMQQLAGFQEINLLRNTQIPKESELKKEFKQLEVFDLQNVYLFINHEDRNVREIIANCVDRSSVAQTLGLVVRKIPSTLFSEESGTKLQFSQNCNNKALKPMMTVDILYFFDETYRAVLERALNEQLGPKGIKIRIKSISKKDALLNMERHKYQAALIRMDGLNFLAQMDALGLGSQDKTLIGFSHPQKQQLRSRYVNGGLKDRLVAMDDFLAKLSKENRVVPIASLKVFAFYPPAIEFVNENNGYSFFEYLIKEVKGVL